MTDPDLAEWRQHAADLGDIAVEYIRAAFARIDRQFAAGSDDIAIPVMIALADLGDGMPLHSVIGEMLIWAGPGPAEGAGRDRRAAWSGAR